MQRLPLNRNFASLTAALLACCVLVCACKVRTEDAIGTADAPLVLVMSKSTVRGKEDQVEAMRAALARESGLHIEVVLAPTSVRAIQLFGGRGADVGLLGPFEYLLARRLHGVEAGLQLLREGPTYQGTILVKADSEVARVEDLRGRRVAYTDPYSLTGFVLPAARLKQAGVDVDAIFAGSHDEALAMLEAGRVHAAATYLRRAEGDLDRRGLRILEKTDPVPNEPIFFRKGLAKKTREAIIRGFEAAASDTACQQALMDLLGCDGVRPVTDETYRDLELVAGRAGVEVESLVPGGWLVHHTSKEPIVPVP